MFINITKILENQIIGFNITAKMSTESYICSFLYSINILDDIDIMSAYFYD